MLALNRSLLNREYIRINVRKALASFICMCNLHVILFSNNTIFCTIYKWAIPSIQLKKRIRRSISMSEVDRPSLVFIDFNIPAFTPGCHRVESTLDLSQNTALLAVCRI
jgi:hypothetical protein